MAVRHAGRLCDLLCGRHPAVHQGHYHKKSIPCNIRRRTHPANATDVVVFTVLCICGCMGMAEIFGTPHDYPAMDLGGGAGRTGVLYQQLFRFPGPAIYLCGDTGNPYFYWGSLLVFLCAITYAFYLAGMGRMVKVIPPSKFTIYSMMVAAGAVFVHFFIRGISRGELGLPADPRLWEYSVLLALVATVFPSFMISAGMRRIGANNAAIITSIGPVSTILQAHFILGDPIFTEQVIGTLLVIIGVLLTGWKGRAPASELD